MPEFAHRRGVDAVSYFDFVVQYGPRMLSGIGITVLQLLCATALAILISLIFGLMRLSKSVPVQGFATGYIEFFRGTSLLVQLYWIYFVLPLMGLKLEAFAAGFIAFIFF